MQKQLFFLLVFFFTAPMLMADVLVLKNGKRIEIDGSYEVKGRFVVFHDKSGELIQLPSSIVDLAKSKEVTAQLIADKEALANAPAPKAVKKVTTMAEIVTFVEKRNSKNPGSGNISISDGGLESYNETHERVVDGKDAAGGTAEVASNPTSETSSSSSSAENGDGAPTAEQLSDPDYMDEKRKEIKENYTKAADELEALDKEIKEAEYMRDVNASSAAFGSANYAGEDEEGNPVYNEDPDSSPYHDQMDKADSHLTELQKKREEKEKEISELEGKAKQSGVRDYNRSKKAASGEKSAPKSRYSDDGKRKRLYDDNSKKRESAKKDKYKDDSRYDENGKRKKINN